MTGGMERVQLRRARGRHPVGVGLVIGHDHPSLAASARLEGAPIVLERDPTDLVVLIDQLSQLRIEGRLER